MTTSDHTLAKHSSKPEDVDFQLITEKLIEDEKLMVTLNYMTEFMRQVVENGTGFNGNHLFILLLHFDPE